MRRIHIALSVENVEKSVVDYTKRLNCSPCVVVPNEYALWRTEGVNLSIRQTGQTQEKLRHLGWEDPSADGFTEDQDINGIVWENFSASQQAEEINSVWPNTNYIAKIS